MAPFSPVRWARIQKQRAEKSAQLKEMLARVVRLQKELEVLERKQSMMVEDELRNISEVESEEQTEDPVVPDLLFDMESERLQFSDSFDWDSLDVSSGFLGSSLLLSDAVPSAGATSSEVPRS